MEIDQNKTPGLFGLYLKALFKSADTPQIAEHQLKVKNFRFNPEQLSRYQNLIKGSPQALMIPFVFVASQKAQLMLLTHPQTQLKILGLIHRSIEFQVSSDIDPHENFELTVRCDQQSQTDLGFEFELSASLVNSRGLEVLSYRSAYLVKSNDKKPSKPKRKKQKTSVRVKEELPALSLMTAKDYAWVSKDLNPIHIRGLCRLFGFKNPIAHGMYQVALLCSHWQNPRGQMKFSFMRPALLPMDLKVMITDTDSYLLNSKNKIILHAETSFQD